MTEATTSGRPLAVVTGASSGIGYALAKEFAEHGYERTTLREIAGKAGIDASLVIRYFGSKDGLVADILRRARRSELELMADLLNRVGDHAEAVAALTGAVDQYPLRESLRALLVTALYRSGRSAEARRPAAGRQECSLGAAAVSPRVAAAVAADSRTTTTASSRT